MFDALAQALAPPVLERLTLVLNHVLRSEPVALARLAPHAGREIAVELGGWPALLPPAPPMRWCVTPAGMLEWRGVADEPAAGAPQAGKAGADLRVVVDASNPAALLARALAGERPAVQVEGDAAFAADVGWLLQNLRWDIAADLERVLPPAVAYQLVQLGGSLAGAWRAALKAASPLVERFAPGVGGGVGGSRGGGRPG